MFRNISHHTAEQPLPGSTPHFTEVQDEGYDEDDPMLPNTSDYHVSSPTTGPFVTYASTDTAHGTWTTENSNSSQRLLGILPKDIASKETLVDDDILRMCNVDWGSTAAKSPFKRSEGSDIAKGYCIRFLTEFIQLCNNADAATEAKIEDLLNHVDELIDIFKLRLDNFKEELKMAKSVILDRNNVLAAKGFLRQRNEALKSKEAELRTEINRVTNEISDINRELNAPLPTFTSKIVPATSTSQLLPVDNARELL